jgi:hypothetical protein
MLKLLEELLRRDVAYEVEDLFPLFQPFWEEACYSPLGFDIVFINQHVLSHRM